MTKRERFQLFLDNKPVDRVPVAFFHHFIPFGDFGKGLLDDAVFEKNIQGHRLARQLFDPDIAKIMNDSLFFMPLDVSFVERPPTCERWNRSRCSPPLSAAVWN